MGMFSKAFKKITKPFSKALGEVTGANATKAASAEQSRQLDDQRKQEQQATLQQVAASRDAAKAQQNSIEQSIARDTATQAAQEGIRSAQQGTDAAVDVEAAESAADTDDQGRRVGTREKFMGRSGASAGLRL